MVIMIYMYEAVTATFDCGGHSFTAKGKRILSEGWREIDRIFRTSLKEKPADGDGGTLPDFTEGQIFDGAEIAVTEHFTQPPKPYPYVWGGSNPNTSFDCSGFVSWVLTQSGVCNTGRLGAQGLYNISTPVSSANARPGDLIFFVGTYDTPGVSHVGIYVGGGKMLHCGDPIQYADINTSYWQSHFYAFGRPPYN